MSNTKTGARHSTADQKLIQTIHDHALELGAVSPDPNDVTPKSVSDVFVSYGDEVKALGDGRIGGYLVRYSSEQDPDLTGDYFTKDTDFGELAKLPMLYHHGLDVKVGRRRIGTATVKPDDVGLWIEAQLNLRDEYEKAIYGLVEKKKQGLSSGAAAHAVTRAQGAKAAHITQWYIAEASITPTPAEPRNDVLPLKALSITDLQMNAPQAEPQAALTNDAAQAASVAAETIKATAELPATEEKEMEKEQYDALVSKLDTNAKELADMKALWNAPATNGAPGVNVPNVKTVTERGFKDDEVKSFLHWVRTGDEAAYKAAMQGQTDSEGGYAVPDDFYKQIVAKRDELSVMRLAGASFVSTGLDRLLVPTEGTAATKFVVTAEEGSYDENEPTLGQSAITVHKMTKLIKISEELEADAKADFGGWLSRVWGRAQALAENYYFVNVSANGSSQPASVTYGATAGTAVASQTATTAAELLTNIYAVPSAYSDNLALVMRRATLGAMRGLTGNPFAFIPTPQGSGDANTSGKNAGYIHGLPVYVTDELPAQAAANKPMVIFNPDFYVIAERSGMTVQRNPWLYQATGQIGLFANFRIGGVLTQALAAISVVSKT